MDASLESKQHASDYLVNNRKNRVKKHNKIRNRMWTNQKAKKTEKCF